VIEANQDGVIPLNELDNDGQKIVIFDDYLCEKKIRNH